MTTEYFKDYLDKLTNQYKEGKKGVRDREREEVFKQSVSFIDENILLGKKTTYREAVDGFSPFFINKKFTNLDEEQQINSGRKTYREYLEESYAFLGESNAKNKINMDDNVLSELLRSLTNKKLTLNSQYEDLTIGQKNTLVTSKEFRRLYRYYFKDKNPTNYQDFDEFYNRLRDFYDSLIYVLQSLIPYLNITRREEDIIPKIKDQLSYLQKGLPPDIYSDFEENYIDRLFAEAEFVAANNEESFNKEAASSYARVGLSLVSKVKVSQEDQIKREVEISDALQIASLDIAKALDDIFNVKDYSFPVKYDNAQAFNYRILPDRFKDNNGYDNKEQLSRPLIATFKIYMGILNGIMDMKNKITDVSDLYEKLELGSGSNLYGKPSVIIFILLLTLAYTSIHEERLPDDISNQVYKNFSTKGNLPASKFITIGDIDLEVTKKDGTTKTYTNYEGSTILFSKDKDKDNNGESGNEFIELFKNIKFVTLPEENYYDYNLILRQFKDNIKEYYQKFNIIFNSIKGNNIFYLALRGGTKNMFLLENLINDYIQYDIIYPIMLYIYRTKEVNKLNVNNKSDVFYESDAAAAAAETAVQAAGQAAAAAAAAIPGATRGNVADAKAKAENDARTAAKTLGDAFTASPAGNKGFIAINKDTKNQFLTNLMDPEVDEKEDIRKSLENMLKSQFEKKLKDDPKISPREAFKAVFKENNILNSFGAVK